VNIKVDTSRLGESQWHEYLIRFGFGGAITALTGIIAKHYGPEIGGLFLAFPAIFPATATLIEKHEEEKKQRAGMVGTFRARAIAGVDAAGTSMGAIGLAVFALIAWRGFGSYPTALVLTIATVAWAAAAGLTWIVRKFVWIKLRRLLSTKTEGSADSATRGKSPRNRSVHG
jgi:hypothetical protein